MRCKYSLGNAMDAGVQQVWGSDAYYRNERQETKKEGTLEKVGCNVNWA